LDEAIEQEEEEERTFGGMFDYDTIRNDLEPRPDNDSPEYLIKKTLPMDGVQL
jgi:hypothetical protein